MATAKIPAIKSTTVTNEIEFVDGVKIKLIGSNTIALREKAYLQAKENSTPSKEDYKTVYLKDDTEFTLASFDSKNIKFSPGTYKNVKIKNPEKLESIAIDAKGLILVDSAIEIMGGNNISIDGIEMRDCNSRAVKFGFTVNNFKISNSKFINCVDMVIVAEDLKEYDGTDKTINKGFKLLNCLFDNCAAVGLQGNLDKDIKQDLGRFENIEIAYNTWKNSRSTGKVFFGANISNYDIHHNTIDNLNQDNNNHNGIFEMQGNGKFHDNKFTNYQGNSIRAWLFSWGNTPATVEIYNNICYNTRKYGGFELQEMPRHIWPGKTTFANAKVYNNTVGHMNTNKDWEGQVLDVYNFGGKLEYFNNLGFDLVKAKPPIDTMLNNMSNVLINASGNRYFTNWQDAVSDLDNFKTKIIGVGADIK